MKSPVLSALMMPVLATACASPTVRNLRANVPIIVTNSAKMPKAISDCVTAEWLTTSLMINNIPRDGGLTLALGSAPPVAVIDIDERPDGSFVKAHMFKTIWSRRNRHFADKIRACV